MRTTDVILALGFALGAGSALAAPLPKAPAPMTKQQFEAEQRRIETQHKADRRYCDGLKVGKHLKAVCHAQAEGKAEALQAELEAKYRPSPEASLKAKTVTAEANYEVEKTRCEARKGKAKDRCMDLAKAGREAAIRQARVEKVEETGGIFNKDKDKDS